MKKIIQEFKDFAMRGSVLDMAVGVVIGGAITAIVKSLVDDIIMPLILALFGAGKDGSASFAALSFTLNGSTVTYGAFLIAIVNFFLIALALFMMIKAINALKSRVKKEEEVKTDPPAPESEEIKVLKEILTTLRNEKK